MPSFRATSSVLFAAIAFACAAGPLAAQQRDEPPVAPPPFPIFAETATEHLNAAGLMLRVGRPDVARQQIAAAIALNPDREQLLKIGRTFGTGQLLEWSRNDNLQPAGRELLDAVIAAREAAIDEPTYVESLLAKLDGGRLERSQALGEIRRGGQRLAVRLANSLSEADATTRNRVALALSAIGPEAGPVVLALAGSDRPDLVSVATDALPQTASLELVDRLIALESDPGRTMPIREAAKRALNRLEVTQPRLRPELTLRDAALRLLRTGDAEATTAVNPIRWDDETSRVAAAPLGNRDYLRSVAIGLLETASRVAPQDPALRELFELVDGEVEPTLGGLSAALRVGIPDVAIDAIERLPASSTLLAADSPLLDALLDDSRRVQLAAAAKIVGLRPERPFRNRHRIMPILTAFAVGGGDPGAVIADPNVGRGSATAGNLAGSGLLPIVVSTGREAVAAAAESAAISLVVLDPNIAGNSVSTTLAELAADVRTREIPVVVLTDRTRLGYADRAARNHPLARVVENAADGGFVQTRLEDLLPSPIARDRLIRDVETARRSLAELGESADSKAIANLAIDDAARDLMVVARRLVGRDPTRAADMSSLVGTREAATLLDGLAKAANGRSTSPAIETARMRHAARFPSLH